MTKLFIPILTASFLISCGAKKTEDKSKINSDSLIANENVKVDSTKLNAVDWESKVMDTIMSLPEVVELGNGIEKNSKGKNHLAALITETPEDNGKDYYGVKVGEDNGESVVGIYNFIVHTPSLKIIYSDPISGDDLTLDEWRNQPK